jgi:hypothetical protein
MDVDKDEGEGNRNEKVDNEGGNPTNVSCIGVSCVIAAWV